MTSSRQSSFEVRVPASTANMGAGFDCLGLALEMYLSVRATVLSKPDGARAGAQPRRARHFRTSQRSRSKFDFPRHALYRRARGIFAAARAARRAERNSRGRRTGQQRGGHRGRHRAGICGHRPRRSQRTRHCVTPPRWRATRTTSPPRCWAVWSSLSLAPTARVAAVRKHWPKVIRLIVVTPNVKLETKKSRAVLPASVSARRRRAQFAAVRAIRRRARRSPLRSAVGRDAGSPASERPPDADSGTGRGARAAAHAGTCWESR